METLQLKLFLSLCKTLNFTKTANEFYVTQPTVSNYIKSLESSVGVTLLKRDSHSVSLTPEGKQFVVYATQILSLEAEAENRLRMTAGGRQGFLHIATLSSAAGLFSACLEEFVQRHPGVQVNVDILEGADMISAINDCSYDLFFAHEYMAAENESVDYFIAESAHMNLFFHKSIAHKIDMNDWSSLNGFHFVSALEPNFSLTGQIRRICNNRGIIPDVINYYNRADTILLAVNAGVGISILPPQLLGFYRLPNIAALPIEGNDALVNFVVVWKRNGENPDVQKFLQLPRLAGLRDRL